MSAWKLCAAVGATAWLATTFVRAHDVALTKTTGTATISSNAATDQEVPGEVQLSPRVMDVLVNDLDAAAVPGSDYWIGLFASRPSPALQAQLDLPKHQGLVVEELRRDGPASKAGVQRYDILLMGNGKPLVEVGDLMALIDEVKDGKLELDVLRAGKHTSVTVKPVKRPARQADENGTLQIPGRTAAGWNLLGGGPLDFRVIRPGQILPPGPLEGIQSSGTTTMEIIVHATTNLADGTTIDITSHSGQPAKVVVTRGKEKWEAVAGDLSKIPEKIRPEVEKLLHPAFDHMRVLAASPLSGNMTFFGGASPIPGLPLPVAVPRVEERLGALQKQIDEIRRSVDALKNKVPRKP